VANSATRDVVYYHHRIGPEYFQGKGWRGLLVRVLNYCRWKFQLWCAYHTMILLVNRHMPGDSDTRAAVKLRWKEEQDEASTRRPVLGALGQMEAAFGKPTHRLAEGRKNGKWPEDVEPDPTHAQIARYLRKPRQAAYIHARDSLLVDELEWEPVE